MSVRFRCLTSALLIALLPGALAAQRSSSNPSASAETVTGMQAARMRALESGDLTAVDATSRDYLAELLTGLARTQAQLGDVSAAADSYAKAISLNDSPDKRLEYGSYLLQSGRPTDAAKQYESRTEGALANDAGAWIALALAYRAAGDYAQASRAFERSLAIKEDIHVTYALGSALLQIHEKQRAQSLFERLLGIVGRSAVWHVAIGDAYRNAHDYNEAMDEFRKAIAIDPKAPHAEFFLGLTYLQMNEWGPNPESFQHLQKAVALAPHEYTSNFYLGALESTDGSDLASSDAHLRAAIAADASQPEAWIYLGLNANREHKDALAERDLRKAIELTEPDESLNNYQVRRAYFALARLLIAAGRKDEGAVYLAKFRVAEEASRAASSSTIASAMGEGAANMADLAGSAPAVMRGVPLPSNPGQQNARKLTAAQKADLLRQAAELKVLIAEAYNDLGTAHARQQQYAEALQNFQLAEQMGSPSPTLLRNLGSAAFRLSNFAEASRALSLYVNAESAADKAIPAGQRASLMLGFAEFNQGAFQQAATAFGQVPEAAMADARAAYSWAFSLARIGHAQEANHIADQLVRQPLPADELALVCHLYVDGENYEGSLSCYRKAYQADATLALAHFQAGEALIHLDRPQEAVAELEQEEKLSPGNPNVENALAYALLQSSRKDEAQALLVKVTTEHPEQADAQYQLGKLLLEEGKANDAVTHLEASERADAGPDYVHYQLGVAYKKAGRASDAERELKLYREIKDKKREASATAMPQAH